jgi:DNA topoisomerase VI subunit B
MAFTYYDVEIVLTEPLLGTVPKNKEVYKKFIASKQADLGLAEEEVETVESVEESGWTGFHKDIDGHFLYDYAVKGFLCESARTLKQYGAVKQLQDKFKRYCFVLPRKIRLPEPTEVLERPLRAMTAQGPRVALTRSDVVAAGTKLTFKVAVMDGGSITEKLLIEVLGYGRFLGLGQWRTGSYGRFELLKIDEVKAK